MIYDKPFWDINLKGFNLIWLPEDDKFDLKDLSHKGHGSTKNWYENICSFKPVHTMKNTLCAYLTGIELVETLDDNLIKKDCTDVLRRFLNRVDIPYPKEILK